MNKLVADKVKQAAEKGFKVLKEGQANILYIEQKLEKDDKGFLKQSGKKKMANEVNEVRGAVFYNPVQEFNRDFSISVIREFVKVRNEEMQAKKRENDGIRLLEALAATGLRSVRYLKEIPDIKMLVANDLDPKAVELMEQNFEFNDCDPLKYKTYTNDAVHLMNQFAADKEFFDVIDLDPYGSAIPFLESSLASLANGGLMCVTFTDMAVLCARTP